MYLIEQMIQSKVKKILKSNYIEKQPNQNIEMARAQCCRLVKDFQRNIEIYIPPCSSWIIVEL